MFVRVSLAFVLFCVRLSLPTVRSPSKESYRMSNRLMVLKVNSELEQTVRPNPLKLKKKSVLQCCMVSVFLLAYINQKI
jgi:hypothetical protein